MGMSRLGGRARRVKLGPLQKTAYLLGIRRHLDTVNDINGLDRTGTLDPDGPPPSHRPGCLASFCRPADKMSGPCTE